MGQLTNLYVSESYQGLIKLADSTNGITNTLQYTQDGLGHNLPLQISDTQVNITGTFTVNGLPVQANIDTGSFATTGSNVFIGDQTISGSIIFDGGASLIPNLGNPNSLDLIAGAGGWVEMGSSDGNQYIWVDDNGTYLITNWNVDNKQWTFDKSGSLTTPGDIEVNGSINVTGEYTVNGVPLTSGSSGTSGTSGSNGSSGTSGISGSNGTSGSSGLSGSSGTSGSSGSSGTRGSSGTSGTSGVNGSSGTSGTSGATGAAGSSGTSGSSGVSGSSGTSGSNGSSGTSGSNGSSGTSGSSGLSGSSGTSGSNGSSGTSGATGAAGSSGTSGTSGSNGSSGTSGLDGTSGSSGTSGANGTSGTSGVDGTSGTSGNSGTSGTSGTSPTFDAGMYATTGSNTFLGKQTIEVDPGGNAVQINSGDLYVNGASVLDNGLTVNNNPITVNAAYPGLTLRTNTEGSGSQYNITFGYVDNTTDPTNVFSVFGLVDDHNGTGIGTSFNSYTPYYTGSTAMLYGGGTWNDSDAAIGLPLNGQMDMLKPTNFRNIPVNITGSTFMMTTDGSYPLYVSGTMRTQRIHFDGNPFNTNPSSNLGALRIDGNNQGLNLTMYDKANISTGSYFNQIVVTGSNYVRTEFGSRYAGFDANVKLDNASGNGLLYTNVNTEISGTLKVTGSLSAQNSATVTGSLNTTGSINAIGSVNVTGSLKVTGSVNITGSVNGVVNNLTVSSQTASLNLDNGNFFQLALTGSQDIRIEPNSIKPGQTVNLLLFTTGSGTISFPSGIVKQVSGSAYVPTTTTSKDIITLVSFDNTALYLANVKNLV